MSLVTTRRKAFRNELVVWGPLVFLRKRNVRAPANLSRYIFASLLKLSVQFRRNAKEVFTCTGSNHKVATRRLGHALKLGSHVRDVSNSHPFVPNHEVTPERKQAYTEKISFFSLKSQEIHACSRGHIQTLL